MYISILKTGFGSTEVYEYESTDDLFSFLIDYDLENCVEYVLTNSDGDFEDYGFTEGDLKTWAAENRPDWLKRRMYDDYVDSQIDDMKHSGGLLNG